VQHGPLLRALHGEPTRSRLKVTKDAGNFLINVRLGTVEKGLNPVACQANFNENS